MKRVSKWEAEDGSVHGSKQAAEVADAENDVRQLAATWADVQNDAGTDGVSGAVLVNNAATFASALARLIKAREALSKHGAKVKP